MSRGRILIIVQENVAPGRHNAHVGCHPFGPVTELPAGERAPGLVDEQDGVGRGGGAPLHQVPQRSGVGEGFGHGCPLGGRCGAGL